jgi:hypothetical protein
MMAGDLLFPIGGIRLSTLACAAAFLVLAVIRRDQRALLAGWAWLSGFEAAFQSLSLILGPLPFGIDGPIFYVVLGLATVPWITVHGVKPSLRLMVVTAAIFAVWVATGFHVNDHGMTGFDPLAEGLNEAAKTAWAIAYLWPLLTRRHAQEVAP